MNRGTLSSIGPVVFADLGVGGSISVVNAGLIEGNLGVGIVVAGVRGDANSAFVFANTESGQVLTGRFFEAEGVVSSAAATRIVNDGLIGSIRVEGLTATIINDGVIEGGIVSNAASVVRNTGGIRDSFDNGFVDLGDADDVFLNGVGGRAEKVETGGGDDEVTNFGVLAEVDLGAGDDVYVAAGQGRVQTSVAGGFGDDRMTGGRKSDGIFGNQGKDTLVGKGGRDFLSGDNGDDTLFGSKGRDTLVGGDGTDTLYGGADADFFWLLSGSQTDHVYDFSDSGGDRIDLSDYHLEGVTDERLVISETRTHTVVSVDDDRVRLLGIHDLGRTDFVFS